MQKIYGFQKKSPKSRPGTSLFWDVIIVGGGPAGLTAGIHLSRVGFKTLLLEKDALGGQARFIERVENYPGFPQGVSGKALMRRFARQAKRWGLKVFKTEVYSLTRKNGRFCVATTKSQLQAKALVIAVGSLFKNLEIEGEEKFSGRGIYHVSFDRASRFKGKRVAVVGGGDAALHQAFLLSRYAQRVYLIHRGKRFKASHHLQRKLAQCKNIKILFQTLLERSEGKNSLERIAIKNLRNNKKDYLDIEALFVLIGKKPDLRLIPKGKRPDGLFLAGDIRQGDFRQIAIAAGDGIRAAMKCERFLRKKENNICNILSLPR